MDIEAFIQTTLTQIIDCVKKAQDATLMALKKHKTLPGYSGDLKKTQTWLILA